MDGEFMLVMLHPQAVRAELEIMGLARKQGFLVVARQVWRLSPLQARLLYPVPKNESPQSPTKTEADTKQTHDEKLAQATAGESVILVLRQVDAINTWNSFMKDLEKQVKVSSEKSAGMVLNATVLDSIYSSKSMPDSEKEIALFFPDFDNNNPPAVKEGDAARKYLADTVVPLLIKALAELCRSVGSLYSEMDGNDGSRIIGSVSSSLEPLKTVKKTKSDSNALAKMDLNSGNGIIANCGERDAALDQSRDVQKIEDPVSWLGEYLLSSNPFKEKKRNVYFVLGRDNRGKTTQCEKLAAEFNFDHLSVDHIPLSVEMTESNQKKSIYEKRVEYLKDAIAKSSAHGILIEGFPRYVYEAGRFEHSVGNFEFALFLEYPDYDSAIERDTGAYSSVSSTQSLKGLSGQKIVHSASDFAQLLYVIEYYEAKQKLYRIDASESPEDVYAHIRNIFLSRE